MNPTLQKTLYFNCLAPGEVNRTANHHFHASGKGINVTRVLSQLGKKALHLTQLGGALRPVFVNLCEKDCLDLRWVESGSAIRFCYTIIERSSVRDSRVNSPTVTELVEEGEPVETGAEERLLAAYTELLGTAGTVIISGSKARGFSDSLVPAMVRLAREQDKRIILDVRGNDLKESLSFRPDVIKPNLFEFAQTFMEDYKDLQEMTGDEPGIKEKAASLAQELAIRHGTAIILTRGKRPVWYTSGNNLEEYPVKTILPLNTTGSGDAFTAGLAAALDEGRSLKEAIAQGIHCGSLNACFIKPGTICET